MRTEQAADPLPPWSSLMRSYRRAILRYRKAIAAALQSPDDGAFARLNAAFADMEAIRDRLGRLEDRD